MNARYPPEARHAILEGMGTSFFLRRTTLALIPFVTGVLALACGGSAGPSSAQQAEPAPVLQGHHFYTLDLAAHSAFPGSCQAPDPVATFHFSLDLDVQDIAAQGWISLVGVDVAQGMTAPAFMLDSETIAGIVDGKSISFDPIQFLVGEGALFFDELTLEPAEGGKIQGKATGALKAIEPALQCLNSIDATITGVPDVTPPDASLQLPEPAQRLPFESIAIKVDEPIFLAKTTVEVRSGDTVVPAKIVPGGGKRTGFAVAPSIAPMTAFPGGDGLTISLSLADAAGNKRDVELGPLSIVPQDDAGQDLGFEDGLKHWIADPPWDPDPAVFSLVDTRTSYPTKTSNGGMVDALAVQGSLFATIQSGGRLVGHLVPPAGKTHLHLSAAVVHYPAFELEKLGSGLNIKIIVDGATVMTVDGSTLVAANMDPNSGWTGWGPLVMDLPQAAASGFWIQVEPVQFPGIPGETTVLLDDLSFQ
jgi:hypothetical protein